MSALQPSLPPSEPQRRSRLSRTGRRLCVVASLSTALLLVLFAWPHLGDAARGWADVIAAAGREPPLIRAPQRPIRVAAPGDAADQPADAVREMLAGGPSWSADVELLPAAEQPILVTTPDPEVRSEDATEPEPSATATAREALAAVATPAVDEQEPTVAAVTPRSADESGTGSSPDPRLKLEPPPPLVRRGSYAPPAAEGGQPPEIRPASVTRMTSGAETIYRIQIAAMPSAKAAREVWGTHRAAHPDALGNLRPVIEQVQSGSHSFFRVQAGDLPTLTAAQDLCERLKRRDVACVVVRR